MKKRSYIKIAFLSLASMALLSSCLKDDSHYVDFASTKPLVELPAATGIGPQGGYFQAAAFDISDTPQDMQVAVNLAAPKPLSSALTVKLSIDVAALAAYNAPIQAQFTADSTADVAAGDPVRAKPTIYKLLPAADYTSTLSTTIAAGKNLAYVTFSIKTNLIPVTEAYVLPLTITDGGGQQISNYKTMLIAVQVKNKYDGKYHSTGVFNHPTAGPRNINRDKTLATAGANSVITEIGDIGGGMTLTINEATNVVTVSGNVSDAQPLVPVPGKTNTYDPATKTFHLNYQYTGGGGFRVIQEDIVHK